MKKKIPALTVIAILISFSAKAQTFKVITPKVFSDSIQMQQKPLLLDVRTAEEFSEGHLRNALNYDFKSTNFKTKIDSLDKTKTYYVYCRTGKRSTAAVEQMKDLGFKKIYQLEDGMLKWIEEGMQTVKEISKN